MHRSSHGWGKDAGVNEQRRTNGAIIEHTNDCVQIMTVHASKGLEFPVVILPDLHYPPRADSEPLIDAEVGIGLSPKNPSKNFGKSAPAMIEVIKTRLTNRAPNNLCKKHI